MCSLYSYWFHMFMKNVYYIFNQQNKTLKWLKSSLLKYLHLEYSEGELNQYFQKGFQIYFSRFKKH